ncbi:DnaA N-terminal domain-containing protein [Rickettsia australis]|uniref:DnaA-like protein n=1 Tax=Rickettsia australis (strain Cutlack) TaxID=1105110 RepID=H8K9Z0_RICAC|nr:DnaA N-terminal domain-containing protein [Rickettsia australis]AFC71700.1 DnaA-like protein [Rickettsia australis str. Cutlack]
MSTLSWSQTDISNTHDTKSFLYIYGRQSYIPITGCILSRILSCSELSSLEKIYYILADSLSCINSSKGRNRSVSLPAKSWAKRLSCSKSEVFILQHSLEDKGYFLIQRDKNDKGQNNRNIITTTIPDKVFNDLKFEPDRFDLCDINDEATHQNNSKSLEHIDKIFIPTIEGKRQHLEKTKMFIMVPYLFLKQLNSNCSISATSKVIMLYLFTKLYKSSANKYNYDESDSAVTHNSYSIVTSYRELRKELKLHRNSLAKALKTLEDNNLISKHRFFIKDKEDYHSRADKSLWQISVLNVPLITNSNDQHKQTDRAEQNYQEEHIGQKQAMISDQAKLGYNDNQALESSKELECTKYDPACTDSSQLYNKNFVLKDSIVENIDYIDANYPNYKNLSLNNPSEYLQSTKIVKKEFLENELCSFPSESCNNSFTYSVNAKQHCTNTTSEPTSRTVKDISVKAREVVKSVGQKPNIDHTTTIKKTTSQKELRYFYPLSEKDIDTLNLRANREFSTNFVNQLLLKLYIKYPEKRFKNKFTFLSYMEKVLKNEKHQGPLVNHTTFRFSCNINVEEKNSLEYEKYLNQIENSLDTSKEMQVRKKIAGRFSTEVAYQILKQIEFKTSNDNRFITAIIPNQPALSERKIEILSAQIEAVYGNNGYYVTTVGDVDVGYAVGGKRKVERKEEIEKQYSKIKPSAIISNSKYIRTLDSSKGLDKIEENAAWNHIRQGLIEELGEAIDGTWFAKAVAKECKETGTLMLKMPTRFMADWIRNNYSHVIRKFAGSVGVKIVEYCYE